MGTAVERCDDKARRASTRSDAPRCIKASCSGIRLHRFCIGWWHCFSSSPCFRIRHLPALAVSMVHSDFSAGDRWLEPCIPGSAWVRVFFGPDAELAQADEVDQADSGWMRNIGNYVAGTEKLEPADTGFFNAGQKMAILEIVVGCLSST